MRKCIGFLESFLFETKKHGFEKQIFNNNKNNYFILTTTQFQQADESEGRINFDERVPSNI